MRFLSSGFIHQSTPVYFTTFVLNSDSNSLSYLNSKFVLRYGPLRGSKRPSTKSPSTKGPSTKRPSMKHSSTKCPSTHITSFSAKHPTYKTSIDTKRPWIQNIFLYKTSNLQNVQPTKRPQIQNVHGYKTSFSTKRP